MVACWLSEKSEKKINEKTGKLLNVWVFAQDS